MHHTRTALACAAVAVGVAACATPAKTPPPSSPDLPGMPMAQATTTASAPPVAGTAVAITNFAFTPATLSVKVGDTVTWTNRDEEPHTVAADDGSFHSPGMDTSATYTFTFTKPGTFGYICSIHPFMRGTVVVNP